MRKFRRDEVTRQLVGVPPEVWAAVHVCAARRRMKVWEWVSAVLAEAVRVEVSRAKGRRTGGTVEMSVQDAMRTFFETDGA